jgi:hypothetical protein
MEPLSGRHSFFPARCPRCSGIVHLLVDSSARITLHLHNTLGCNCTFHYRCWLEPGSPLPRLEICESSRSSTTEASKA